MDHSRRRKAKAHDDECGQKRRDRPLGQRGQAGKEIDVVEPEFGAGLIPGVPAEQADGQGRGHLHIGGRAAGEADDAGAGDGDERRVEMAAGAESSHVQVDEANHDEGEGGGGQAGAPVVDAEVLKEEHGAPVVEGGLLKPGTAVEIGRDAGDEAPLEGVRRSRSGPASHGRSAHSGARRRPPGPGRRRPGSESGRRARKRL